MEQVVAGHDVLVVLPTGFGKSAIHQVSTLLVDGLTPVVSPLLALQRDQVDSIADTRAPGAVAVNSAQSASGREEAWRAGRDGEPAVVELHYRAEDLNLQRFLTTAKAPEDVLVQVAQSVARHDGPLGPAGPKDAVYLSPTTSPPRRPWKGPSRSPTPARS